MRRKLSFAIILTAIAILLPACLPPMRLAEGPKEAVEISIIPKPLQIEKSTGNFAIAPTTKILIPANDKGAEQAAQYLADRLRKATEFDLPIQSSTGSMPLQSIQLKSIYNPALSPESYQLTVSTDLITIEALGAQGLFYGVQTLIQLLPVQVYSGRKVPAITLLVPCIKVGDTPRFGWRGMMLDVSRHFFTKEFVKEYIDYLAIHKMNTFHWHLTDDQGWRIEIKKYPKLTEVGAWRVDREDKPWTNREPQKAEEAATYGGFYTQDDIKEIVEYARNRFITIIPEIEMPGHCLAAITSYPQYSCSGGPFTVPPGGVWPIKDVYCPGNEETFEFLQNVLSEVIALFPSEYIHIGGDEVDKSTWKQCPKCQARIAAEGLKNEEELQSYFVRRIEKFLNANGKRLIGWDEILEGGLAPNATVMSWRGMEGGIAAAKSGHDCVMTPTSHCYFDYYQGDPGLEPLAIGGYLPLSKVYSFEPVPADLSAEEAKHILGGQANLWTEYVATPSHAQYMTLPRIAAMAEVTWSAKEIRNWEDFLGRLKRQLDRYVQAKINFARSLYAVRLKPAFNAAREEVLIKLEAEILKPEIRFSLDGRDPTANSARYSQPIRIKKTGTLKAATFANGKPLGPVTEIGYLAHKALGKPISLTFPYSERYSGGWKLALLDGLRGSKSHTDGRWQGFEGDDLIAVIDFGKKQKFSQVTLGCLQNSDSWIFLPTEVEFAVSDDGKDYKVVASQKNDTAPVLAEAIIKDFSAKFTITKARYLRIRAKNIGTCPEEHPGAGKKAWLFADEIIVN